jgi:hypothetical protein
MAQCNPRKEGCRPVQTDTIGRVKNWACRRTVVLIMAWRGARLVPVVACSSVVVAWRVSAFSPEPHFNSLAGQTGATRELVRPCWSAKGTSYPFVYERAYTASCPAYQRSECTQNRGLARILPLVSSPRVSPASKLSEQSLSAFQFRRMPLAE